MLTLKPMNLKTESFSLKRLDHDVVLLIRQILTETESEAKQVLVNGVSLWIQTSFNWLEKPKQFHLPTKIPFLFFPL